ncbi:MAG: PAS domain S-box protein [Leptospirales bacterium]
MEKILAGLTNQDASGIIIYRNITNMCFANEFISQTLGYENDELLGIKQSELIHADDVHSIAEAIVDIFTTPNKNISTEARLLRKDGKIIKAGLTITGNRDKSGMALTVIQLENITIIGETAKKQKDPNIAKLVVAIEKDNSSAILVGKPLGGFVYANKKCSQAFGYNDNDNEMMKLRGADIVYSGDFKLMLKNGIKILTGLQTKNTANIRFSKKDGNFIEADLTLSKRKEGGSAFIIMQFDNITDYAEVEAVK